MLCVLIALLATELAVDIAFATTCNPCNTVHPCPNEPDQNECYKIELRSYFVEVNMTQHEYTDGECNGSCKRAQTVELCKCLETTILCAVPCDDDTTTAPTTTTTTHAPACKIDVAFVADVSTSMCPPDDYDRFTKQQLFWRELTSKLNDNVQLDAHVALVSHYPVGYAQQWTSDHIAMQTTIENLLCGEKYDGREDIKLALSDVCNKQHRANACRAVVVLSDGVSNYGSRDEPKKTVDKCRANGIAMFGVHTPYNHSYPKPEHIQYGHEVIKYIGGTDHFFENFTTNAAAMANDVAKHMNELCQKGCHAETVGLRSDQISSEYDQVMSKLYAEYAPQFWYGLH